MRSEPRYLDVVMQEVWRPGDFVVVAGEELLLIVESRPPRERRANLEIFAQRVSHHVFRADALRRLAVVRAARCVNVVITRPPPELRGIDPPFDLKRCVLGPWHLARLFVARVSD